MKALLAAAFSGVEGCLVDRVRATTALRRVSNLVGGAVGIKMRPEKLLYPRWTATGEIGCPLKARMQPLNLLTLHVEPEVLGLFYDLEGCVESRPCCPLVH